jgi:ketosteroid isomerase-like protein
MSSIVCGSVSPDELAARESIRETVARYAHRVDGGRFDALVTLFTADGVLEVEGEVVAKGHAELREFFAGVGRDLAERSSAAIPRIRHHVSNLTIDLDGPTSARASSYFLAVTDAGVDHWGRYRDHLVAVGRDWRFKLRSVRTDGAVTGGFGASRT